MSLIQRTAWHDAQSHRSLLRAQRVVELRVKKGLSYRKIGEEIGISHTQAKALFDKSMEHASAELKNTAKHAIVIELMRLDELWELNFRRATDERIDVSEQQAATDRCLKISEQRRRLLGLDAPEKVELTGADGGPIVFQEIAALEGQELDDQLAGFFNPGYQQGAADGYQAGLEEGKRQTRRRRKPKKEEAPAEAEAAAKPKPKKKQAVPQATGGEGQARTASRTVVIAPPSQGQARV